MSYENVTLALAAIRRGELVVVADDAERENEGDLIIAAERVTPEAIAFMVRHTSGLLCVALSGERLDALQLPLMVANNTESQSTAFTVSVDFRHGTSTGISAADRSATIRALSDPSVPPSDFVRPGHVFPLRASRGGVLKRRGHTEAAVDLARLAGLQAAGALAELVGDDGAMLRGRELEQFARAHGLVFVTIEELAAYRRSREHLVEHVGTARLPTKHGAFTAHAYRSLLDGHEHLALVHGDVCGTPNVLVRVHSECLTGDTFGSVRCDCGEQLQAALKHVADAGAGVVVYLRGHEGHGVGLSRTLQSFKAEDVGRDDRDRSDGSSPGDPRTYDVGAQILTDLGVTTIRLLSNHPVRFTELEGYRLKIVERVALSAEPAFQGVLEAQPAKARKPGHQLDLGQAEEHALQ
jgi:3,4-dihydroxy 2-butanone 4-phosphate synthase/GTP cyclohydrolase II